MELILLDPLARRITEWLWGPPGSWFDAPAGYAEHVQPMGKPVKHKRWHMGTRSRGAKPQAVKPIDEFYHRGAYERHETRARHTHKAALSFRGKGFKTERRRRSRRK